MAISEAKRQQIYDNRRKQILDASLRLFDINGYSKTKISDIAKEAGISKGLIYRYFDTKEDILYAHVDKLNECIEECANIPSGKEAIREFSLRLLSYPYYHGYVPPLRVFFYVFIKEEVEINTEKYPIKEDFGQKYFGELFKRGQEAGEFRQGDPYLFAEVFWKYLLGSLGNIYQTRYEGMKEEDIDKVIKLFEP